MNLKEALQRGKLKQFAKERSGHRGRPCHTQSLTR
jgi:hypothetical protein